MSDDGLGKGVARTSNGSQPLRPPDLTGFDCDRRWLQYSVRTRTSVLIFDTGVYEIRIHHRRGGTDRRSHVQRYTLHPKLLTIRLRTAFPLTVHGDAPKFATPTAHPVTRVLGLP